MQTYLEFALPNILIPFNLDPIFISFLITISFSLYLYLSLSKIFPVLS
jgi:hypothetical protein